jgi:hypothetical protein
VNRVTDAGPKIGPGIKVEVCSTRARRSGQDEQEDASAADHCVSISIAQLQPRFGVQTGDSPKDANRAKSSANKTNPGTAGMQLPPMPFTVTNWSGVSPTVHRGETGQADGTAGSPQSFGSGRGHQHIDDLR